MGEQVQVHLQGFSFSLARGFGNVEERVGGIELPECVWCTPAAVPPFFGSLPRQQLDTISTNLSTTLKELFTPPPANISPIQCVSNTVEKCIPTGFKISCKTTVPGTEEIEVIENSMQLNDSDETKRKLAKINEDIGMAIIFCNHFAK